MNLARRLLLASMNLLMAGQGLCQSDELDALLSAPYRDLTKDPETQGDYLLYLKSMEGQKYKNTRKFLEDSKIAIMGRTSLFDEKNVGRILSLSSEYNQVVLSLLVSADNSFPPLYDSIEELSKSTIFIISKCKDENERKFAKEFENYLLNEARTVQKRLGLPTDLDVDLRKVEFGTDEEILEKTKDLGFEATIGRGKWSNVRPVINRIERWVQIESDIDMLTKASRDVVLERIGMRGDAECAAVFSDPYFNMEIIHAISIVGNGFSLTDDEKNNIRFRCRVVASRTKTGKQLVCLMGAYGLILQGDQIARRRGK